MEALLYFAVWAAVLFLMMRFGFGVHVMGRQQGNGGEASPAAPGQLRWVPPAKDVDPVCGKEVRPDNAKPSVYDGTVYYFCSRDCREVFEAAPDQYLGPQSITEQLGPESSHA